MLATRGHDLVPYINSLEKQFARPVICGSRMKVKEYEL